MIRVRFNAGTNFIVVNDRFSLREKISSTSNIVREYLVRD